MGAITSQLGIGEIRQRKSVWISLLTLMVFALVACTSGSAATNVSNDSEDAAPDFELTLFDTETRDAGEVLKMSDLRGKPVVVNFWFPSCPPCVAEMPDLNEVFQDHRSDGLEMIGVQLVGLDTVEAGQDFVSELGVAYALGPDENGDIIRDYGINGFPTTVFIDKDQNISRKWTGILDREKMDELVSEILN